MSTPTAKRRTSVLDRRESADDLRASSTHSSKRDVNDNEDQRSVSSNHSSSGKEKDKRRSSASRRPVRRSKSSSNRRRRSSKDRLVDAARNKEPRRPRRQLSKQKSNLSKRSNLSNKSKDKAKEGIPATIEAIQENDEVIQQRRQEMKVMKLEMENEQLKEQLEQAWHIIGQLRKQQMEELAAAGNSNSNLNMDTDSPQTPTKKSKRKSTFWSREKAATFVGLEGIYTSSKSKNKKKSPKSKKSSALNFGSLTPNESYSEMGDSPGSSRELKKEKIAQTVASALEKQMSYRTRSSSGTVRSMSRRSPSTPGDLQVLIVSQENIGNV